MIKVNLEWVKQQLHSLLSDTPYHYDQQTYEKQYVTGVSTDTRTLKQGDLFIALKGPNFDGHEYLNTAKKKGAIGAIVSVKSNIDLPCIYVKDTRLALGQLAKSVKQKVAPKTIGITGSSGKTTVKEMVKSILSQRGKVLATKGNFNNDIGVPLTLLDLKNDHDYAVVEMGANHQGEIEYTCSLVQPDVSTIINAAPAHIEGFGSLFGVARAKSEIIKGLQNDAISILNRDSQFYEFWQGTAASNTILTYSYESKKGDFYADKISLNDQGCAEFELVSPQGKVAIKLRVPGLHNVGNAVLSAALSMSVGAALSDVATGLFDMHSVSGRLNVKRINETIKVIDDTYNANVGSVKAALDLLAVERAYKIFVFGDMGELGDQAAAYHQQIGEYALQKNINKLLSCGNLSRHASSQLGESGQHFQNTEEALQGLLVLLDVLMKDAERVSPETPITILVKGSRSAKMEQIVKALLEYDFSSLTNNIKHKKGA